MERIKLRVTGSEIEVAERPAVITAGTYGLRVEFVFDRQWEELNKIAVFRAGEKVIAVEMEENPLLLPWEVLEKPNLRLGIGVYGINGDGTVIIPTLWAEVAVVHTGVNPEGDPAMDPTLPVWQEISARMDNLTPELLGAATAEECAAVMSEAQSAMQLANETGQEFLAHRDSENNPHGVTAEQAGAAPAGYGLGESSSCSQSWHGITRNGFYRANTGSPDGDWWYGLACKYYAGTTAQIAFKGGLDAGAPVLMAIRHHPTSKDTDPWAQWEYINPPMEPDVEYRTTQRYEGKPVYTKLVNLEAVDAEQAVVAVANDVETVVDAKFTVTDGGSTYFQRTDWQWHTEMLEGVCTCQFSCENVSDNATARLLIKYTKTS